MVIASSSPPTGIGMPFQSSVTFMIPVTTETANTRKPSTAIRRMPRLRGISASRERCHQAGPW